MMDVSIIIPYNKNRGYLEQAFKSALKQKFTGEYEIIPERGEFTVGKNINNAIKQSKAKYIKILAEDDILTRNCLQDLFDYAETGFDVVCSNSINFDGAKETPYKSIIPETISKLSYQNTIHGGTVLYNRQMLVDVGLYNEDLWTGEEFELYLRLADNGYKFGYVDATTYKYRLHNDMKSMQLIVHDLEKFRHRKKYIHDQIRIKYINNHKTITR